MKAKKSQDLNYITLFSEIFRVFNIDYMMYKWKTEKISPAMLIEYYKLIKIIYEWSSTLIKKII